LVSVSLEVLSSIVRGRHYNPIVCEKGEWVAQVGEQSYRLITDGIVGQRAN